MYKIPIAVALVLFILPLLSCGQEPPTPAEEPTIEVGERLFQLPPPKEYTVSAVPVKDGEEIISPADLNDMTWISPGKVNIGGFYPGGRAEYPITIHNGEDEPTGFLVYYKEPSHPTEGFTWAPGGAESWVFFEEPTPILQPKETRTILVVIEIPSSIKVDEDRWEFWVAVRDISQSGAIRTELACRWLISMAE